MTVFDENKMLVLGEKMNELVRNEVRFVSFGSLNNYDGLGIDDVGVVISTFNIFTTGLVAARQLKKIGYQDAVSALKDKDEFVRDLAEEIINLWVTVFGKDRGVGEKYVTALKYDFHNAVKHGGMEYVKVELGDIYLCFERASKIGDNCPLDDIEAFCIDADAIKRFYGEYTIDATKKPEKFLANKPFFGYMQRASQRSRKDFSVGVNFVKKSVVEDGTSIKKFVDDNNMVRSFLSPVKRNVDGAWGTVQREDGRGIEYRLDLVDVFQRVRNMAAQPLVALAQKTLETPVQKLPKAELGAIAELKRKYRNTLYPAISLLKEEWHSMSTAIRRSKREAEEEFGKNSIEAEMVAKGLKQHANTCYNALTNQLRQLFEIAGISDPIERVRVILGVVIGNQNKCDWSALSDFSHSALPEEWFVYVMFIMKDDPWTPQETMDEVELLVELTDEQLVKINGKTVVFDDGIVIGKNGEPAMISNGVNLNGEFVLRVSDKKGKPVVYACHNIVDLVKIPSADKSTVLFCTSSNDATVKNLNRILSSVSCEVQLMPYCNDAIMVQGENLGKFRCSYDGKTVAMINELYGARKNVNGALNKSSGVAGKILEVVNGIYEDKKTGSNKDIAVIVLSNVHYLTEEEADCVNTLPEPGRDKRYNIGKYF